MARIAVFGGTGYLGAYAVRQLAADGHHVRALTRTEPAQDTFPDTVETARADMTRPETLPAALEDMDGVLICVNGGHDKATAAAVEDTGVKAVAEAAAAAGVRRIVLISGMYSQPAYATYHWEQAKVRGEEHVLTGMVPATVLRLGFINETLAQFLRGGKPVLIGKQPHPVRPIAADDVMAAASRALVAEDGDNHVYDVAGTEAMGLRDAVDKYARAVTGKEQAVRVMPLWFMKMLNATVMGGKMTRPLGIMQTMDTHGDVTDTTDFFRDYGRPPTSFADWLAQQ